MTGMDLLRAIYLTAAAHVAQAQEYFAAEQTSLEQLREKFRQAFGPPLKSIQEPFDAWLGQLPMSVAMSCAIGLFVIAILWTWGLSREFVFRGAPDRRWWRDLRLWATVVVLPYIVVYSLLGR